MSASPTKRVRQYDHVVLSAIETLDDALRDKDRAQRELARVDLTPTQRGNFTRTHDRAAEQITTAIFELKTALQAFAASE